MLIVNILIINPNEAKCEHLVTFNYTLTNLE